ncbi:MAG: hypothetical protein ACR2O0_01835 [Rhizobiaceae bacterium]
MMIEFADRPRLTRFDDVLLVVREMRKLGISGKTIYQRITEIGPVDLDMLNAVLRAEQSAA